MLKESSKDYDKKKYSEATSINKERIICKDGFCSLTNQKEISKPDTNDINLFDPI